MGTPYDGLYWPEEASLERGTFCRVQVYERVGISLVEVNERVEKFVILVCRKAQKVQKMHGCKKSQENVLVQP